MHAPVLLSIWLVGTIVTSLYFLNILKSANFAVTGLREEYEQRVRVVMAGFTVILIVLWPFTAVLLLALRLMRRPT